MYRLYPETPESLIVLFDKGSPGSEERLQREVEAWGGFARVEALTADCRVLTIRRGGATRLAS